MKKFTVVRANPELSTITVLMEIDDKTLQQDVPVESFELDEQTTTELVRPFIEKFEEDLANAPGTVDLGELVDRPIEVV